MVLLVDSVRDSVRERLRCTAGALAAEALPCMSAFLQRKPFLQSNKLRNLLGSILGLLCCGDSILNVADLTA